MDDIDPVVAHLFAAKEARRRRLAQLSFPEKVRAVVRMQEMVAPLLRARGRLVSPWHLPAPNEKPSLPE